MMNKEQNRKNGRKRSDVQGDTVIKLIKQEQVRVPFLYRPVKDPFEKQPAEEIVQNKLYRVVKFK